MNSRIVFTSLVLVAVLAVAFSGCTGSEPAGTSTTPVGEKTVYKVGIDVPYVPFSFIDEQGNPTGFDVESIEWIAGSEGFEVEFKQIAWDGIIPALQAGQIDMVYSGMTITDARKEKVDFSIPYWTVNQDVIVTDDSVLTMDEVLNGSAILGTQSGCTAQEWIEENLVGIGKMSADDLKVYANIGLAINDLEAGRIDAVMYDDLVLFTEIQGRSFKKLGNIETNEEFGIAVRKGDTELLDKLDDGLTRLMADPYWSDLIVKYSMGNAA